MSIFADISKIVNRKSQIQNPKSGLYHYTREDEHEKSRIHLRLDADSNGTLIVNANRVMHLNPSAALMAYLILEKVEEGQAVKTIQQKYRVSQSQARADYSSFIFHLSSLFTDACPIHDLELDTTMPFSSRPSAPYRMDLAVTYRCNNDCAHCYNARERNFPELTTEQWFKIMDDLWALGVPHIGDDSLDLDGPLGLGAVVRGPVAPAVTIGCSADVTAITSSATSAAACIRRISRRPVFPAGAFQGFRRRGRASPLGRETARREAADTARSGTDTARCSTPYRLPLSS